MSFFSEDNLIQEIKHLFNQQIPSDVIKAIGDDTAVIKKNDDDVFLVTTDCLIENVHFFPNIPPEKLAFKSVSVNVSDIISMGGKPLYVFLSLGIPKKISQNWVESFFSGLKKACMHYGVFLIGGDTCESKKDIFINITLIGEAQKDHVKYRHNAQPNDIICTLSALGDSYAGLKCLKGEIETEHSHFFIEKHFNPVLLCKEAQWLAQKQSVNAMMDLSDGLYKDLNRLCLAANCGAEVEVENIPYSNELYSLCQTHNMDIENFVLGGGEDYALLFTVSSNEIDHLVSDYAHKFDGEIYKIGKINQGADISLKKQGKAFRWSGHFFEHFE